MDIAGNSFSLFVLYLVISGNFLAPLFSCRLRQFIEESMIVRNILGFLTLTFFVVIATKSSPMTYANVLSYSAIFYIWFLMSTRMNMKFWMIFILLIGSVYLIRLYQSELTSDTPTPEEMERFNIAKKILTILAGIVTAVGFLIYFGEKRIEYGELFQFDKFLLGTPSCKGESPNVGFFDALRGIFRR